MRTLLAALIVASLAAGCSNAPVRGPRRAIAGGDAVRGAEVIQSRECGTCHRIPGIRGARGRAAPPLDWMARRTYIAGRVPNAPETMAQWVQAPEAIDPTTAMPNLGLTPQQARDVAAYLLTLH